MIWVSVAALTLSFAAAVSAQTRLKIEAGSGKQEEQEHHYAQLREVEIQLKDFYFDTLDGGKIRLSEAAHGPKLVLIHYFAAWCHNSNYDVLTINELYRKYRDQGLAVIGVCEYSSAGELREFIEEHKPEYPICLETEGRNINRKRTTHYAYRKLVDDERAWGTPLNILLSAEEIDPLGEIVARHARIAAGELIKTEIEDLIREKLLKK